MDTPRLNVVCIDACRFSEKTFMWYVKNYHRVGDTIGLLHIHQTPSIPTLGVMDGGMICMDEYSQLIQDSTNRSKSVKVKYVKLCKENNMKYKLMFADDYHSIGQVVCSLAKENKADAIFCGKRGLNTISRALLGSTSDYIVHHANVPVIIVPVNES